MSRRKRRHQNPDKAERPASFAFGIPPALAAAAAFVWTAAAFILFLRRGMIFDTASWRSFAGLLPVFGRHLASSFLFDLARVGGLWFLFDRVGAFVGARAGLAGRGESLTRCALGAGTVSLVLLLLGCAGGWHAAFLRVLFYGGVSALLGFAGWRRFWGARVPDREADAPPSAKGGAWGPWEWAAAALVLCAALTSVFVAVVPEIFYDSLVYHLALPQLYLHRGGIVATPENIYSGLPFGLQMLFGWALALSNENMAALLHATFGVGTAGALWAWGRRYAAASTGVLAALLFYLCPITLYGSWHCGVDLGASFYGMAALWALSRGLEPGEPAESRAWSVAAGLLTGFAMSTKYNVFPIGAALLAIHFFLGRRLAKPARDTLWMGGAAAAVLAPWLVKNAVFYGNPLYPFLHGTLGWTRPIDWEGFMVAAGSRGPGATFGSWAGFWDAVSSPWKASFGDRPAGDWPGPAFILFVPWVFLLPWGVFSRREEGTRPSPAWTAALLLAVAGTFAWGVASRLVRYALPALPFLSLIAATAVDRGRFPNWLRRTGWAAALFACMFNFCVALRQGSLMGQWNFLNGGQNRRDFLTHQRVTYGLPYYAAMEHIGAHTPPDAKVLFLGESRAYYCPRDFIAATLYDENPFWAAVKGSADAAQLHRRVKSMGVTHIFLSARQLMYRRFSAAILPRELVRTDVFGEFWSRYLTRTFEDREDRGEDPRWLTVYRVLDAPNTDPKTFASNPARVILDFLDENERPDGTLRSPSS